MSQKRGVISISLEAKLQMDDIKSEGQSYDGIIRELNGIRSCCKYSRKEVQYVAAQG